MNSQPPPQHVQRIPMLPARDPEGHKGDYGRVLIVAGSRGMSGAACLAGVAALRAGAGLVRVACPRSAWPIVAAYEPSYLTWPLPEDAEGRIDPAALPDLIELCQPDQVHAIGPGLGQSPGVSQVLQSLLGRLESTIVLDADGLNALQGNLEQLGNHRGRLIITPHPGEFARLLGTDTQTVQASRTGLAVEFSRRHRCVTLLKGHRTVVTDGDRVYINHTGNPGMATGGSGDVLTGLLAGLAAQKLEPFEAAVLGTYLHGLAGDLAARELSQLALIASDLLSYLPAALGTV